MAAFSFEKIAPPVIQRDVAADSTDRSPRQRSLLGRMVDRIVDHNSKANTQSASAHERFPKTAAK